MPITVKLLDMVRGIKENGEVSLIENAKNMGISERNLRYKIDDYNYYLKLLGLPEIEIRKREIVVKNTLEEIVKKVAGNMSLYSFTKDEREKIIITDIFFNNENISLETLEEKLDISELTLKNDLKVLENYMKTFIISLDSKTLAYQAEERNVRRLILDILLKNYNIKYLEGGKIDIEKNYQYGFFICWDKMDEYFKTENVNNAMKVLKNTLDEAKKTIGDENFKILLFYILITFKRFEEHPLKLIKNMEFLTKSEEYAIVERKFSEYGLSKSEILNMTEYFLGSHSFGFDDSFYINWVQIELSMMRLIKEVAKSGYEELEKDMFLLENLINHMKPAIYRAKKGIRLPCEIYDEFKETYPLVLNLVSKAWNKIGIDIKISDDELAYIAMHFQLAMKRIKSKKLENILIVCGAGYSTSRFLSASIKEHFNVNIVNIIPYNELENYKNEDIDLVVTTIEGVKFRDKKVIKVSPILSTEDIIKLKNEKLSSSKNIKLSEIIEIAEKYSENLQKEEMIKELKKRFKHQILDDIEKDKGLGFLEMLAPSRITIIDKTLPWEEAIERSALSMIEEGFVGESYPKEIMELINGFGNYMVVQDGIFLGHSGNSESINKTGISLAFFKKPVEFPENEKVRIVLTLASRDKREHLNGLMEFLGVMRKKSLIKELDKLDTSNKIYKKIEEFINEEEK
ncbi:PRD domain-containing protein [Fusobacterium sp. SB021]|uniref:BglG family transcription antiterminator n=1 Tax=Fusobacterium sp. SB021 TaxID=2744227 RepID=UPI003CEDA133